GLQNGAAPERLCRSRDLPTLWPHRPSSIKKKDRSSALAVRSSPSPDLSSSTVSLRAGCWDCSTGSGLSPGSSEQCPGDPFLLSIFLCLPDTVLSAQQHLRCTGRSLPAFFRSPRLLAHGSRKIRSFL